MTHPSCYLLIALAPCMVQAGDGVQAALQAAQQLWPEAEISSNSPPAACASQALADAPGPARNGVTQVRVRCTDTPGWTRYIALRIEQSVAIAVLHAPLARGQMLKPELIDWQQRDVLRQSADVMTKASAMGSLTARRDLPAGSVLAASQFVAPQAIQRGQSVTLLSRAAGMEVRAPGEALADAALGARVQVRNKNSRRVVEGTACADGTVEVAL